MLTYERSSSNTPFGRVPDRRLPAVPGFPREASRGKTVRWWNLDAHDMARHLPRDAFDLVIANSVWEHLQRPFVAMRQVLAVLRPGGLVFWHTPFYYPMHGVPRDYHRRAGGPPFAA